MLEPAGVGIEDFMWPLMFVTTTAKNADDIGVILMERNDALVADWHISYDHTDIVP